MRWVSVPDYNYEELYYEAEKEFAARFRSASQQSAVSFLKALVDT